MIKKVIKHKGKRITRLYLQAGDEVQTSEETLRETATYITGNTFQIHDTDLMVPYYISEEYHETKYLPVEYDKKGAYVDIPKGYNYLGQEDFIINLEKIKPPDYEMIALKAKYTEEAWVNEVVKGGTLFGYETWVKEKSQEK